MRVPPRPSQSVQRNIPSNNSPALKKREPPVHIGGQAAKMNFVPALVPPQRKMANSRPSPSMALLVFLPDIEGAGGLAAKTRNKIEDDV